MIADLRLALRQLRKAPGFAVTAVLTLALAIGANAIVFSVLNALVLRPLNVPHPENLFMVERNYGTETTPSQSYLDYRDLRDMNRSFDSLMPMTLWAALGWTPAAEIPAWSGPTWSAAITSMRSAFSRILADSSMLPKSMARTACRRSF